MQYRTGFGYDIHRLVQERKLMLAGIEIPYIKGLQAHSDGDVVLHAICDAILGAMAKGDIGEHFPPTDPKYDNIDSSKLLQQVDKLAKNNKYKINNIDATIVADEPRLEPFKKQMSKRISEIFGNNNIPSVNQKSLKTYSQFIHLLKKNKCELDRKVLSQLAEENPKVFADLVKNLK